MMGTKVRSFSPLPYDLSLEDLIPEENFYRRLEARLDLSFVRDLVGPLYANGGRPSVDPVVFFKLQLVMFFEDIRSERQLMGVVSDRLSLRWYLGYDLFEPLPDHTPPSPASASATAWRSSVASERLRTESDRPRRLLDAVQEGRHAHGLPRPLRGRWGKARVILNVLVTPADVTENQPMLDLLFKTRFRWRTRVRRVTGDAKYGTKEIVAAVEKASIRAYVSMADFEKKNPYYGASRFVYESEGDLYICPRGEPLRLYTHSYTERLSRYRADLESCNVCPLKPECTPGDSGRVQMRSFDEEILERVRAYRQTEPYEKALRKRRVWVEPMFAEAKEWHGMRRFRLRTLRRVNAEALVIAAGQNIKRLLAFSGRRPKNLVRAAALRPPALTPSADIRLLRGSQRRRSTPLLARFSTGWPVGRSSRDEPSLSTPVDRVPQITKRVHTQRHAPS